MAGGEQMSRMSISQLVDSASELLRFHTARAALVAYLATAAELRWRFRRLNKSDRRLQAVDELTAAGICSFRMCADACAFLFAQSQPDRSIPGFNSAGDVFYGRSLACATRAADWEPATLQLPAKRPRKKTDHPATRLLDRTLLRDLAQHADDFMAAVRALPHFQPAWEDGPTSAEHFGRRLYVGRLRVCEQRFHKQFARAAGLLDETPLCAQDRCELLLLLSRRIPAAVARHVDAFVA